MHSYEIEIKSLLGDEEAADAFRKKVAWNYEVVPKKTSQKNHYFEEGDLLKIPPALKDILNAEQQAKLEKTISYAKTSSVRTANRDGKVLFIIKATIDDTSSENGTARIEFEEQVPVSLDELDARLLKIGFHYQAKWSRDREEYVCPDVTICIDKNAGYGYLAEFERMIDDPKKAESTKADLRRVMQKLEVKELPQDRLKRMFQFYNDHWPDYYGTDKTFIIE
jgi:adenylate cyclase class IV